MNTATKPSYIDWITEECKQSTPEQITEWLLKDVLRGNSRGTKYRTLLLAIQQQRIAERELVLKEIAEKSE